MHVQDGRNETTVRLSKIYKWWRTERVKKNPSAYTWYIKLSCNQMRGMHSTVYISKHSMQAGWQRLRVFSAALHYKALLCSRSSVLNIWWLFHTMSVPNPQLHCKLFTTAHCGQIGWGWAGRVWVSPLSLLLRQVLSPTLPSPCNSVAPCAATWIVFKARRSNLGVQKLNLDPDMATVLRKSASGWV